jgi:Uma2 family endonuclease
MIASREGSEEQSRTVPLFAVERAPGRRFPCGGRRGSAASSAGGQALSGLQLRSEDSSVGDRSRDLPRRVRHMRSLERDTEGRETVLNPTVLVEVLSAGTERYDRGEKFEHFKKIPTLQDYVLVSQKETSVEVWHREGTSWSHHQAKAGERLPLPSIDCELDVDELYRDVFET